MHRKPKASVAFCRDVVGACNIRTKHLTGVLNGQPPTPFGKGDDNFKSPTVKYLRIDDRDRRFFNSDNNPLTPFGKGEWSLKSSSVAGVNRRERRKPYRRRLGIPEQLTLLPLSSDSAIQSGMWDESLRILAVYGEEYVNSTSSRYVYYDTTFSVVIFCLNIRDLNHQP